MRNLVDTISYFGGFLFGLAFLFVIGLLSWSAMLDMWQARHDDDDIWDLTDEEWEQRENTR